MTSSNHQLGISPTFPPPSLIARHHQVVSPSLLEVAVGRLGHEGVGSEGVSYRPRPQSGDGLEAVCQTGGRARHVVSQTRTGRNHRTEEQRAGPGAQAGRLLQSGSPLTSGRHTLSHVFLQGARNTEGHLAEPALVDVLPHPPVSLHMSEASNRDKC